MWKALTIGTAALALLAASGASAQTARDRQIGSAPAGQGRAALSREDASAYLDARIAALHSGLQLTPDQEKMWPAVEQAWRDLAKRRLERTERAGPAGPAAGSPQPAEDPVARLRRRAEADADRGEAYKSLADALAPLWQSFDDGQKRRFSALARPSSLRLGFGARSGTTLGRDDFGNAPRRFGFDGPRGRDRDEFDVAPRRFGFDGPRGRDRDEYDRGPRRFGFDGPRGRDRDEYDRGPRRFGFDGPRGRDRDEYDRGPRRFGFDGPRGRDRDEYDGGPRGFGFDGPRGRDRDEYDRGPRRFGFDGPRGRDRDEYDRGPRGFGFDGPRGRDRDEYDRGPRGREIGTFRARFWPRPVAMEASGSQAGTKRVA